MVVQRLRERGVTAMGVDGSKHALRAASEAVRPFLAEGDITAMGELSTGCQLVVCTEVAEHLDEKHAAGLVALLCSAMCPVIFTAAPPGQDGHHHVNCQEPEYWIALFARQGLIRDLPATWELQMRWEGLKRLSHMTKNVMVFR